jgi:hypothetical protein
MDEVKEVVEAPETPTVEAPVADDATSDDTLLGGAGKEVENPSETPEQKLAREATEATAKAEEKRLLDADDKTLTPEDLAKKQALVKAQADAKANTVPEKYEVKVEGFEVKPETLEALSPTFKEMGLTNAQVQKLAEAYAPVMKAQVEAQQKEAIDAWHKQGEDWKAESVKMLGSNAKTDMVFAAKFMDRFGGAEVVGEDGKKSNELRVLMQETKIGNNPVMLKSIIEAGKLLGEDTFVEGSNNSGVEEQSLYDHPSSKATMKFK